MAVPEMTYERDASIKALRVYVDLEGHPYSAELRFFDDGRFEVIYAAEEEIVANLADAIEQAIIETVPKFYTHILHAENERLTHCGLAHEGEGLDIDNMTLPICPNCEEGVRCRVYNKGGRKEARK